MVQGVPLLSIPGDFWHRANVHDALRDRDIGTLFRLVKRYAGASQRTIGTATGLGQGYVNKLVNGRVAATELKVFDRIADGCRMPDDCRIMLGLAPQHSGYQQGIVKTSNTDKDRLGNPEPSHDSARGSARPHRSERDTSVSGEIMEPEDESVKRSDFLRATGLAIAGTVTGAGLPQTRLASGGPISEQRCAQWLAWTMREKSVASLSAEEIPAPVVAAMDWWAPTSAIFRRTTKQCYEFTDPLLIDHYIAERVFESILSEHSALFARSQTSHEVDLLIGEFVRRHEAGIDVLRNWISSSNPVLRVNSAGVLAKLGSPVEADSVIGVLKGSADVRELYLTAVAGRVLGLPWGEAGAYVRAAGEANRIDFSPERSALALNNLANEVTNPRDDGARWCSIVLISRLSPVAPDTARAALHSALRLEKSAENLRSIGAALSGIDPISV